MKMNAKKKFIKDYVDRAFADTSRYGMRATSFYKWRYADDNKFVSKSLPQEDENGFKTYFDEGGKYYVRNFLRPYEFKILYAEAKQAFDEQVLNFPHKDLRFSLYSLLDDEDVERFVVRPSYDGYPNTSEENQKQIKKNREHIAQLMKQNYR